MRDDLSKISKDVNERNERSKLLRGGAVNLNNPFALSFADESPRWLLATGREERAGPVIGRLLEENGMPHSNEDVGEVIQSTLTIQKEISKVEVWALFRNRATVIETVCFGIQL